MRRTKHKFGLASLFLAAALSAISIADANAMREPLGIRSNNPGNLIKTDISWEGEVPCNSRFECFESPEMGIRAMAKNLISYQSRHNLDTIRKIINRWSPPHENSTRLLSDRICDSLGYPCSNSIELVNSHLFTHLVVELIIQENGYNPYPLEMIEEIIYGLTNSNGNPDNGSRHLDRWYPQVVGDEAGWSESADPSYPETDRSGKRLQAGNTTEGEQTLPMDKESYCLNGGILCDSASQTGSSIQSGIKSNSWLDRVESGVLIPPVFRGNIMADYEWDGDHPPRHPRPQFDPWSILRRLSGGA